MVLLFRNRKLSIMLTTLLLVIHDPGAYASLGIVLGSKTPHGSPSFGIKTRVPCKLLYLKTTHIIVKYLVVSQALRVVIKLPIPDGENSKQVPFIHAVYVKIVHYYRYGVFLQINLGQGGIIIIASQVEMIFNHELEIFVQDWVYSLLALWLRIFADPSPSHCFYISCFTFCSLGPLAVVHKKLVGNRIKLNCAELDSRCVP